MARIIRCPACGALWRLDGEAEENYRCGSCGRDFAAAQAKTLDVDDKALDEAVRALAEEKAKREAQAAAARAARAAQESAAAQPEPVLMAPVDAVPDDVPPMPQKAREPAPFAEKSAAQGEPMAAVYRTKKSGIGGFFTFVVILIAAAAACVCALLMMHQFVLAQAPYVRPVYEKVCRSVPCPGFVWSDASAFRADASLIPDDAMGLLKPVANVVLTNDSEYPQMLPVIEVKYLDPAGSVLMQRVLEPADYGFPQKPAVLPARESLTAQIRMEGMLPFAATAVAAKPIVDPNR